MIIKNNYNEKDVNPLNDYTGIGKGSHSLDKILENIELTEGDDDDEFENPFPDNDLDINDEDDIDNEDKWSFFR